MTINHQQGFIKHSMLDIHLAYISYDFRLEEILSDQCCVP